VGSATAIGYYAAHLLGEHLNAQTLQAYACKITFATNLGFGHIATVQHASAEWNQYLLAGLDYSTGVATPNACRVNLALVDLEDAPGSYWSAMVAHVYDPNNAYTGLLRFYRLAGGTGNTIPGLVNRGGKRLAYVDYANRAAPRIALPKMLDSMVRANSATLPGSAATGQLWTASTATWGIASNQMYVAVTGGGECICLADGGLADGIFQWRVKLSPTRADALLLFRAANSANAMILEVVKVPSGALDQINLFTRVASVTTKVAGTVAAAGLALNTTYTVTAVCQTGDVAIYLDNSPVLGYTGTTGLEANTLVGVGLTVAAGNDDANTVFTQVVTAI
jgi:hypothetical protein